jgi:hypothetical protein
MPNGNDRYGNFMYRRNVSVAISPGLAVGLFAAILTIVVPAQLGSLLRSRYLGSLFSPFGVGHIFGLVLAAYYWIVLDSRSIAKALGFVFASTAAFAAAWWLTFWISSRFGKISGDPPGPLPAFFLGGAVGAFLIVFAAQLLFGSCNVRHALMLSLGWCSLGGVLGALGWALGPSLGKGASFLVGSPAAQGADSLANYSFSCFLTWQTGMGQILDNLLASERVTSESDLNPTALPRSTLGFSFALLLVASAFAVGWVAKQEFTKEPTGQFLSGRTGRVADQAPLLENLPRVESVSVSQILIPQPVAGYVPTSTVFLGERPATYDPATEKPTSPRNREYAAHYAGADATGGLASRYVDVNIQEFPDSDWAKWMLRKQTVPPFASEKIASFSSVVFANRPAANSNDAVFVWISGRFMVRVQFIRAVSDDFLKAYLQKYPSSL